MSAPRTCACGCGRAIPDDYRSHARYVRGHRKHRSNDDLAAERASEWFWGEMTKLTAPARPPRRVPKLGTERRPSFIALARRLGAKFPEDGA
jgi:hypothetical protein